MKNKKHKILVLVAIVVVVAGIGAYVYTSQQDTEPTTKETRMITDMAGRTVEIPTTVNTVVITCCGGVSQELVALGAADKVIAQPHKCIFLWALKIAPHYKEIPDAGFYDNANVEEILNLNPDIVIAPVSAKKGNKKIEESGIPIIGVLTGWGDIERSKEEFRMIGAVLNNEKEADALISYWNSRLKKVDDRVSNIPTESRKKVYYMRRGALKSSGEGCWGNDLIVTAGGINVAQDIGDNFTFTIPIEQILEWNPDVIIIGEGKSVSASNVKNNPQFTNVKAVKNNQVYDCPIGAFWWDRPSPESPLGIMWLAKTLYPKECADIDLAKETKEFYKTFYHYDLSDEEVYDILNPGGYK